MNAVNLDQALLRQLEGKTAILTGAAGGIGAEITRFLISNGANVVMADLELTRASVEAILSSLPDPSRAMFVPTDILKWVEMVSLFKQALSKFGSIEFVIANAGVMERKTVLDIDEVDEAGDPVESKDFSKVIDINLKGTMNTLKLGLFYMKGNEAVFADGSKGSIILISSTSGYFGSTGVAGYISSKHGVTGLLRGSQNVAAKYAIRVNGVAPFVTPTAMSSGFAEEWKASGLPTNTATDVARVVSVLACDDSKRGSCYLTCGPIVKELEQSRTALIEAWFGEEASQLMKNAGQFFKERGGYTLPSLKAID
ncbi:hypothetical protein BDV96DRAFT_610016 [Lophiotrema nucula]|uniref:Uncharacterized protein n=1 Tax=Lophiotrema nucula TaxID=690887 RepID=A0A6A5ZMV3_9PLEO|nr:hypothetical protein BDV96DRAFT_610016 [Lophiotrema nucula]